jgi:hypothetical protein
MLEADDVRLLLPSRYFRNYYRAFSKGISPSEFYEAIMLSHVNLPSPVSLSAYPA